MILIKKINIFLVSLIIILLLVLFWLLFISKNSNFDINIWQSIKKNTFEQIKHNQITGSIENAPNQKIETSVEIVE